MFTTNRKNRCNEAAVPASGLETTLSLDRYSLGHFFRRINFHSIAFIMKRSSFIDCQRDAESRKRKWN